MTGRSIALKSRLSPLLLATLALLLAATARLPAWEHEKSAVDFQEYTDDVIGRNRGRQRPFFLLFSAQWCHWCHVFAEESLSREEVYTYLNEHFTSVFIDADIHNAVYVKYRATGLPFTVFLNPDGTIYFRYGGTLYGDDFLDVIRQIKRDIEQGGSAPGEDSPGVAYRPPETLSVAHLAAVPDRFRAGVLENFDPIQQGVGRGEKAVLPRTFLYLLASSEGETRSVAMRSISATLGRAIEWIFDPVEGGFFRYAETREWQVPHYEKMADLNAGAVVLMQRLDRLSPSASLRQTAEKTLGYLTATLFNPEVGSFVSFQEADTRYYLLDEAQRRGAAAPRVIAKIFTDRLANTLAHLSAVPQLDPDVENRVTRSLDFLATAVQSDGSLRGYYALSDRRWRESSRLRDYALVSHAFQRAAVRFRNDTYRAVSEQVVRAAYARFFNPKKGIFVDPMFIEGEDVEYLMESNGLLAQTLMGLGESEDPERTAAIESVMTYFSAMQEVLEDRLWESSDWERLELYVPYLEAIDVYLRHRRIARQG